MPGTWSLPGAAYKKADRRNHFPARSGKPREDRPLPCPTHWEKVRHLSALSSERCRFRPRKKRDQSETVLQFSRTARTKLQAMRTTSSRLSLCDRGR